VAADCSAITTAVTKIEILSGILLIIMKDYSDHEPIEKEMVLFVASRKTLAREGGIEHGLLAQH
jgi:hypothetical protein